jgi:hypothetical protein
MLMNLEIERETDYHLLLRNQEGKMPRFVDREPELAG